MVAEKVKKKFSNESPKGLGEVQRAWERRQTSSAATATVMNSPAS